MTAPARSGSVDGGRPDGSPAPALDLSFDGDVPRTAQQLAYQVVRRAILQADLEPGTRLTQSQLAEQLSISTTPVREALRRLAGEGLVRIDAHRGAIVRGLDKEELLEIYEVRLLLEPLAIRKAVERIGDEALAQAEALWERMNDHSDIGAWSDLNREFHGIFAQAARSPNLIGILRGLRDSAAPYVRYSIVLQPGFSVTANQEHRELLDACRARDADRAAAVEEKHLRATLAAVMEHHP
jgi:DNA-binding GntR family transcriptional regulator